MDRQLAEMTVRLKKLAEGLGEEWDVEPENVQGLISALLLGKEIFRMSNTVASQGCADCGDSMEVGGISHPDSGTALTVIVCNNHAFEKLKAGYLRENKHSHGEDHDPFTEHSN